LLLIFLQGVTVFNWCYNLSSYCGHGLSCNLSSLLKAVPPFFVSICFLVIIVSGMHPHTNRRHSLAIAHLSFLLTIQVFSMGAISLLPTSEGISGIKDVPHINTRRIDFICTLLSWMIVVTTPNGPPTHYPQERIYSSKTLLTSGNFPEENVSGEYSMSIATLLKAGYDLRNKKRSPFSESCSSPTPAAFSCLEAQKN